MTFFQNPEIKKGLILFFSLGTALSCIALFLDIKTGIACLIVSLILFFVFFSVEYRRYRKIADLTKQLNNILTGSQVTAVSDQKEGEISILKSEINKLLVRLSEQNDRLLKEKQQLGDLLADISHQLRTPLTGINLVVSLLKAPDLSEERKACLLRELIALLSATDRLVDTLLKTARLDAGAVTLKHENVLLDTCIQKICAVQSVSMDIKDISFDIQCNGVHFTGDADWTAEALGNIIKNCVEHAPIGGNITLTAQETPIFTQIEIYDNAGGFNEKDIPHLFERFYKGENAGENSFGIGLNLAKMIITNQNGTIKACNKNGGAYFEIKFYKTVV